MSEKKNDNAGSKKVGQEMSDEELIAWEQRMENQCMMITFTTGAITLLFAIGAMIFVTVQLFRS